jgi:hypothetical protein
MKRSIFAASLTLAAVAAHAATVPLNQWDGEWFHLDTGPHFDSYITRSVKNADGTQTYWMRVDYKQARNIAGKAVSDVKDRTNINCATGMIRNVMEVQYDADGQPVQSFNSTEDWQAIVPGSEAALVQGLVCQKAAQ